MTDEKRVCEVAKRLEYQRGLATNVWVPGPLFEMATAGFCLRFGRSAHATKLRLSFEKLSYTSKINGLYGDGIVLKGRRQ